MPRFSTIVWVLVIALAPAAAEARGGHRWSSGSHGRAVDIDRPHRLPWRAGTGGYWTDGPGALRRREHRRRSAAAKAAFRREHPCPSTGEVKGACPGYVIDHVIALKRGGPDSPSNMQWQSAEAARAKDKVE